MLSKEMKEAYSKLGLNYGAVESKTADVITKFLMGEGKALLVTEAERQVNEMRAIVSELEARERKLDKRISAIVDAEEEYGKITDTRAKNAIALYAALVGIGNDPESAGYIVYAYLGGQAKRDYGSDQDREEMDDIWKRGPMMRL